MRFSKSALTNVILKSLEQVLKYEYEIHEISINQVQAQLPHINSEYHLYQSFVIDFVLTSL